MCDVGTSLYYLYSTISQTVAGAAGFLAAVAAYKLQSLETQIQPDAGTLVQLWTDVGQDGDAKDRAMWDAYRRKDYAAMMERLAADRRWEKDRQTEYARFSGLAKALSALFLSLKVALGLTAVAVLGALAVLASVHRLTSESAHLFLVLGPIVGGLCLASYLSVVWAILRRA